MNDNWIKMALESILKGQSELGTQVHELQKQVHHLDKCLDSLKLRVDDYREDQREEFDSLQKTIRSIVPNGDFDGHRKDHELRMVNATRWQQWRSGLVFDVLRLSLFVGGGWAAHALWDSFKAVLAAGGV
ncbi:hypothetical protein [Limnobacter sp. P1]|uniref:hypothetical protein n=1 Tax=Limnobacter olei TaxID=3031298 RepID=UPI0023AE7D13|nr:hypothetical protein [Limnobacter sp. P1]